MKLSKDGGSLYCMLSEGTDKLAFWSISLGTNQGTQVAGAEMGIDMAVIRRIWRLAAIAVLTAGIGAFIGWQGAVFSLMASSLIGSVVGIALIVVRKREWSSRMPYGPYIALAAVIWVFGGNKLFHWLFP